MESGARKDGISGKSLLRPCLVHPGENFRYLRPPSGVGLVLHIELCMFPSFPISQFLDPVL